MKVFTSNTSSESRCILYSFPYRHFAGRMIYYFEVRLLPVEKNRYRFLAVIIVQAKIFLYHSLSGNSFTQR